MLRDKGYSPEDIIYMFTAALNTEIHIRIMEEKFEKEKSIYEKDIFRKTNW